MLCAVCHTETPSTHGVGRPRKYCSTACRQRAYRQRHEHVSGMHQAAATGTGCGGAGQVVAVLYLPAAVAGGIEQKADVGMVIELGILGVTHVQPRSAKLPSDAEEQTSGSPDPDSRPAFR